MITSVLNLGFLLLFVLMCIFNSVGLEGAAEKGYEADSLVLEVRRQADRPPGWNDRNRLRGADSVVLVPGKEVMSPLDAKAWLKDKFLDAERELGTGKVRTMVYLQADGDVEWNELVKMMNFVKAAGFKRVKIRAMHKKG